MKIVFFGSSKYVIPALEVLKNNSDLCLVVTTEKDSTEAVPAYCKANNIPYLSVDDLKNEEVLAKIKNEDAEVGVLGYFGRIVPQDLLSVFPKGIVNIHPSLLPLYRGPTPVQTALLNGDTKTGTTIIVLDKEVDHGPILSQQTEKILPDDTTDSLHSRLFKIGAELIKDVLPKYLNGKINPIEQEHGSATCTNHLSKKDGQFDIESPADKEKLDRMIRAYFPWPTAWTRIKINGKEKLVKFLPGQRLQVEGGKPMSTKDFLNGYPEMKSRIEKLFV